MANGKGAGDKPNGATSGPTEGGTRRPQRPTAGDLGFDPGKNPYPPGTFAYGAWLRMQERRRRDAEFAQTPEGKESARFHGVRQGGKKAVQTNRFAEPVRGENDWTTQHYHLDEEPAAGGEGQS